MTRNPRHTRTTSTTRPRTSSRGATTAEYLGVLVVVAAIIAALAAAPIGARLASATVSTICTITRQTGCTTGPTATGPDSARAQNPDAGADPATNAGNSQPRQDRQKQDCGGWLSCTLSFTGSLLYNVGKGVVDDVVGVWDLITDPGSLVDAGKYLITHPIESLTQLVWDDESSRLWKAGDHGGAIGRTGWNLGSWLIPGYDVAKWILKPTKFAADAAKIAKVAGAAADAEKAADRARKAAAAGDKAAADAAARDARKAADDARERARDIGCPIALSPLPDPTGHGGAGRSLAAAALTLTPSAGKDGCDDAAEAVQKADADADRAENAAQTVDSAAAALRPEAKYQGSGKHGVKWTEGPALAKSTNIPQGQWSAGDLAWAGQEAAKLPPRKGAWITLPEGSTSVVHMPDGTTMRATRVWIRNNGTGTFHGYPALGG